jgi:hypothetical protein
MQQPLKWILAEVISKIPALVMIPAMVILPAMGMSTDLMRRYLNQISAEVHSTTPVRTA